MADLVFNNFKELLLKKDTDFVNDTLKVMLLTSSASPDQDAHDFIDDLSANEVSGAGYSAGGATLASKAVTQDNTDNEGVFDANDVSWTTATITARYAVLYRDSGSAATSPVIAIWDFTTDKSSSGGTFQLTWNAEGILNVN